jgi:hypothetical protein
VATSRTTPGFPDLIAALPDFGLGAAFLVMWIAPATFGARALQYFVLVMLLEFVIMHSSAIMGNVALTRADRGSATRAVIGFGVLYSLAVIGFALAFRTWWPLLTFWGLTANRMLGILIGHRPSAEQKELIRGGWAASAVAYLLFTFATVLLPLPRLGVTRAVVEAAGLPGEGLWVDQPHRVLALGFFYFMTVAWSGLHGHRLFRDSLSGAR